MATTVPEPVLDARDEDVVAAQAIGALPPELADRSDGNPAIVLIEAAAWILGKVQYIANRFPSAVIQKCLSLVGITLEPATAATVSQTFTLSAPRPSDTAIPEGTEVATSDGSIVFATTSDLTIEAYTAPAGTITFTAGSAAVTGAGTSFELGSTWVGWQIGLQGAGGAAPATWYAIASVTNATNLTLTANAALTASGAFYAGPISGSVTARATTTGSDTNVGAGTLTSLQDSITGVISTTNNAAASGGAEEQTVAAALEQAPKSFATRDVACSAADYAEFARRTLGSGGRAIARRNTNVAAAASGYVSVGLLSPDWTVSTPVSTAERASVVRDLNGRQFTGATLVDLAASIYQVTPAICVYKKSQYADAQVRANAAAAMNTWLSPNTYEWGRIIYPTDLAAAVEAAEGVDRVHVINGVVCAGTKYAQVPAALNLVNGNATAATASTAGLVAGQTIVIDATNNIAYLVVSLVANTSVTFHTTWGGATGVASPYFFLAQDDDGSGGTASPLWYYLPYSNLDTDVTDTIPQVVVVGSV